MPATVQSKSRIADVDELLLRALARGVDDAASVPVSHLDPVLLADG